MQVIRHINLLYPSHLMVNYGNLNVFPRIVTTNGSVMSGSSCGLGVAPINGAYGEFIERNYFTMGFSHDQIGLLGDYCSVNLSKQMASTINQVKGQDVDPLKFSWRLIKVKNLFTLKDDYSPFPFFCLFNCNFDEAAMIPHADSCGSAAHNSREAVIRSAMFEFLERQALVGAALLRKPKHIFYPEIILECTPLKELATMFLENGEIQVYNLAHGLPGYAIFITYFSKSENDQVQYATGASYALNFKEALFSALNELWQDYYFIYTSDSFKDSIKVKAGSRYNLEHLSDNKLATRSLIPYAQELQGVPRVSTLDEVIALPTASWDELLEDLNSISPHMLCYYHHDKMRNLHFARVFNPDFFIHMSLMDPLNLDNAYSRQLGIEPDNVILQRIPFP